MNKTFLIIGGYGNTGKLVAKLILEHIADANIVIAGRDLDKAKDMAVQLNNTFAGERAQAYCIDVSDTDKLVKIIRDTLADMIIIAAGTIQHTEAIARAALETGTDYLDTQLSNAQKLNVLNALRHEIDQNKRIFITDAGFHPGVPAAMVRYAAQQMDELYEGIIYSALRINWKEYHFADSTFLEMMDEFKDFKPQIYNNGAWESIKWKDMPRYDFGGPVGTQLCTPMVMHEFAGLPDEIPSLQKAGFFITGFNPVVDYLIIPLIMTGLKLFPGSAKNLGRLFVWGIQTFCKPPWITQLVLEARGITNTKPVSIQFKLQHTDAYYLTAAPIAACLKQYAAGMIKPGLWYQANAVDPGPFFTDLKTMGIQPTIQSNKGVLYNER